MTINCLSCGHGVNLDDAYDDYEGEVKCLACHAKLQIRTEQGGVKLVRVVDSGPRTSLEEVLKA